MKKDTKMNEKILYISDLDGTLITNDKKITEFSSQALRALIEQGLLFTYATARSYVSASAVTIGFEPKLPVIIYNGTFILMPETEEKLLIDSFTDDNVREISELLVENGVLPLVYAFIDGEEKYSYVKDKVSIGQERFIEEHKGDKRENPVCEQELFSGTVFHFTCIGDKELLLRLNDILEEKYQCVYYNEQYSGEWWLEIHPKGATKANAIEKLKHMLGVDKVVCFGDGKNDISMFLSCDEGYAMANAEEQLKEIATGVIGDNENDGVVRWLLENVKI